MKTAVTLISLLLVTAFIAGCSKQQEPPLVVPDSTQPSVPDPSLSDTQPTTADRDIQSADDDFAAMDEAVDTLQ